MIDSFDHDIFEGIDSNLEIFDEEISSLSAILLNNDYYNFMMDGTGQRYSYDYPVSDEEVNFVNSKERIKTIVKWLWVLCLALMFLVIHSTTAQAILNPS